MLSFTHGRLAYSKWRKAAGELNYSVSVIRLTIFPDFVELGFAMRE